MPGGGQIVGVAAVIATAVNADGRREILGLDLLTSEDGRGGRRSCGTWWPGDSTGFSS